MYVVYVSHIFSFIIPASTTNILNVKKNTLFRGILVIDDDLFDN